MQLHHIRLRSIITSTPLDKLAETVETHEAAWEAWEKCVEDKGVVFEYSVYSALCTEFGVRKDSQDMMRAQSGHIPL